jgi:hypothetical protein
VAYLEPHERYVFETASEKGVALAAARIKRAQLPRNRLIATTNDYVASLQAQLVKDSKPTGTPSNTDLGDYLAATACVHVADGWSYLGRALQAHLAGDGRAAVHLAYYAELRAALGLLPTQGIGIYDGRHVTVDELGLVRLLRGKGTHEMTWLALKFWADSGQGTDVLGEIVAPWGVPLSTWVAGMPNIGGWAAVGKHWLLSWGIDLERLAEDRVARNRASYDPTRLIPAAHLDHRQATEFVDQLWRAFEPAPADPFFVLDKHLLRRALEFAYTGATTSAAKKPKATDPHWETAIDATIAASHGSSPPPGLKPFFLRQVDGADLRLLSLAEGKSKPSDATYHLEVIARAALLLRVATGCCNRMMRRAGIREHDLKFWLDRLGEERGIWHTGSAPADFADLWTDIEDALNDLDAAYASPQAPTSYRELFDAAAAPLRTLATTERIPLWSAA